MNTNLKIRFKAACASLLSVLLLASCVEDTYKEDEFDGPGNYEPEIAIPLIKSSLSVEDMLTNYEVTGVRTEPNNLLTLFYIDSFVSDVAENYIEIQNLIFDTTAEFDFSGPELPQFESSGSYTFNLSQDFEIEPVPEGRFSSATLKNGRLFLSLRNEFEHRADLTITFPSAVNINTGEVLELQTSMAPATPSSDTDKDTAVDLTGYRVSTFEGPNEENLVRAEIDVTLTYSGTPVEFNNNGVTAVFALTNMEFSELLAYLGQVDYQSPLDTFYLDVFDISSTRELYIHEPKILLDVYNSFGVPVGFQADVLTAFSRRSGDQTFFNLTGDFNVDAPSLAEKGEEKYSQIVIDKNNSNIQDVIANRPTDIEHQFSAVTNPEGSDPTSANFVLDDSRLRVTAEVELPLWGYAKGFRFIDTFAFDAGTTGEDIEEVQYATFRLSVANGFPAETDIQVYFIDNTSTVIDSLFGEEADGLIPGTPEADRLNPPFLRYDIPYDGARLENLLDNATAMVIVGEFETTESPDRTPPGVRFYADSRLQLELGLKAKFKFVLDTE